MDLGKLLKWIPGWLGFLLLILTGIVLIIVGAADDLHPPGYFVTGAFAIAIGAFSWIVGGVSRIKGRVGDIGVLVEVRDLPFWAWIVDGVLTVAAFSVLLAVR